MVRFFNGLSLDFCIVWIAPFLFILALYCACWCVKHAWAVLRTATPGDRRLLLCLTGIAVSGALFACERFGPVSRSGARLLEAGLLVGAGLFYAANLAGGRPSSGGNPPQHP